VLILIGFRLENAGISLIGLIRKVFMQQRYYSSYFINLNWSRENSNSDEDITHLCLYVLAGLFGAISDRETLMQL